VIAEVVVNAVLQDGDFLIWGGFDNAHD
jgi:hypothetical protein